MANKNCTMNSSKNVYKKVKTTYVGLLAPAEGFGLTTVESVLSKQILNVRQIDGQTVPQYGCDLATHFKITD